LILIDSTIYIDWFRRRVELQPVLEPWVRARAVASCGVIRAEVLRGILHPLQKERLSAFFDVLEEVPTESRVWRESAELAWELDRKGSVLPLTDVVIATCARSVGAAVVTLDGHFSKIPGLKVFAAVPPLG